MTALHVMAPAKVNLLLLVGPVQPDGYHPLLSVMAPLALADELDMDLTALPPSGVVDAPPGGPASSGSADMAPGVLVTCPGVAPGTNLVDRALALLERETGWVLRGAIAIRKHIPAAGGMGGGSSDAAAALVAGAEAVRAAGGPSLAGDRLVRLAACVGADVPFFLEPGCKLARGRGEILEPLRLPQQHVVLILPEEELSTKSVYAAYDDVAGGETAGEFRDRCDALEGAWRGLEASWLRGRVPETDVTARVGNIARNDLERAAYRMVPDLFARRLALEATGASLAMMSGSGPTMFALYPSDHGALRATTELQDAGYEAVCTETEMWPAGAGDPCLDAP